MQNVPGRGLNAGRYGRSRESKGDPGVWCAREGGCSLHVRMCEHVYLCLVSEPGGVRGLRRASWSPGQPSDSSVGPSAVYVSWGGARGGVGKALGHPQGCWHLVSGCLVVAPPNSDPLPVTEMSGCPCRGWLTLGSWC